MDPMHALDTKFKTAPRPILLGAIGAAFGAVAALFVVQRALGWIVLGLPEGYEESTTNYARFHNLNPISGEAAMDRYTPELREKASKKYLDEYNAREAARIVAEAAAAVDQDEEDEE
jgi:hypothetical protein